MLQKNLIFFGSPDFSASILESILKNSDSGVRVVAVVTSPDKPLGRKQVITPSPVALLAGKYDLPVFKPEKLDDANLSHLRLLKPDLFLVVSFKKIIPKTWLTTPTIGTFNIHFSLLPKYRGALCISEPIKNQDKESGVTLMVMDEGLDTGPIITQSKVNIGLDDDVTTLTEKLTQSAIVLLRDNLPNLSANKFTTTPQNDDKATLTPVTKTRTRETAFIGWSQIEKAIQGESSTAIHALIRSLNPDPGAWTKIDDIELKILQTHLTNEGKLQLEMVQIPGKNPVTWKNFISGHPLS